MVCYIKLHLTTGQGSFTVSKDTSSEINLEPHPLDQWLIPDPIVVVGSEAPESNFDLQNTLKEEDSDSNHTHEEYSSNMDNSDGFQSSNRLLVPDFSADSVSSVDSMLSGEIDDEDTRGNSENDEMNTVKRQRVEYTAISSGSHTRAASLFGRSKNDTKEDLPSKPKAVTVYTCTVCKKEFSSRAVLGIHAGICWDQLSGSDNIVQKFVKIDQAANQEKTLQGGKKCEKGNFEQEFKPEETLQVQEPIKSEETDNQEETLQKGPKQKKGKAKPLLYYRMSAGPEIRQFKKLNVQGKTLEEGKNKQVFYCRKGAAPEVVQSKEKLNIEESMDQIDLKSEDTLQEGPKFVKDQDKPARRVVYCKKSTGPSRWKRKIILYFQTQEKTLSGNARHAGM